MPIILEFQFSDGSTERHYIPAEIWRFGADTVHKVFYSKKELTKVLLDPNLETADIDLSDNAWQKERQPTRFELFIQEREPSKNPMQQAR